MRVSQNQVYDSILYYVRKNSYAYYRANEKVASGKEINRPSDNPEAAGRATRYRTKMSGIQQYQENIGQGKAFLNHADTSLGLAYDLLVSAKEIALSGANANRSEEELLGFAGNVSAIRGQLVTEANAKLNGQYLFAGYKTTQTPYDDSGTYSGDSGTVEIRVGENSKLLLNLPGDEVFGAAGGGIDIFQTLNDLETALTIGDTNGIQQGISSLEAGIDQISAARAAAGFRINHLENVSLSLDELNFDTIALLSETEDADMTEAIMEFSRQEIAFQAAMAASARLLQTNLLQFLE